MTDVSVCLYFPQEPQKLFQFLESVTPYAASKGIDPKSIELLLFVDNDDHKVSTEFYTLRRYVRKLNVQVFINPSMSSSDVVFEYLSEKTTGDGVVTNNGFYTDIGELLGREGNDPVAVIKSFSPPPEVIDARRVR